MKAAVLHAPGQLVYQEVPTPRPGPGEVLLRVRAAGICGSDLPRVHGKAAHFYPIILGHEFSGVIERLGEGVEGLTVGQRATAAPLAPCRQCADCQRGDYALCKRYSFIGSSRPGSFADFVLAPAANIVPFADSVPFIQAAFFEPSTVALHGLRQARFIGGTDVLILGGGTIGLFVLQWARLLGAGRTMVVDVNQRRLSLARRLGAEETLLSTQPDFLAQAQAFTNGRGFPFVFEAAGRNETMGYAFELAANRARVCFVGTSSRDLTFPWKQFELINRKEFTLTGSWMSYSAPFPGEEWAMTADYLGRGLLRFDEALVDRQMPMRQAEEAFALFLQPGQVQGKVMLVNEEEG